MSSPNLKNLNESFGSYKAEWLRNEIFELFTEPSYFPALQDNRPCVLEGGRGTGKTTVLRGLSWQGQYAIHKNDIQNFDSANFIGIYHRVNTNHVRAFREGNLTIDKWQKVFGHYFNLLICREILLFLQWHGKQASQDETFAPQVYSLIAKSINWNEDCNTLEALIQAFEMAMYTFQSEINNIVDGKLPSLSLTGDPIRLITDHAIRLRQFTGKIFFILLDEYENYEDYQQMIINTLIKHSTECYTFKIGVRELGWRVKHTLNHAELLHDPADYVLVNIQQKLTGSDTAFSDFAKGVCQQRIRRMASNSDEPVIDNIEDALPGLTIEEEAEKLAVQDSTLYQKATSVSKSLQKKIQHLPDLYKYFIAYWATTHDTAIEDEIAHYLKNSSEWDTRYENYKYEILFKIRRGRGKSGIQKFYCGWTTYTKLANGNIRYLMELVYRAYEKHIQNKCALNTPISPRDQTLAAQESGEKNLVELEGLWKNGAQLTKLLLGIGRVFQVLASSVAKSAPEKNQFAIQSTSMVSSEFEELISAAVMHLALVRSTGNKLDDYSTKDFNYMIHPVFSAFFQFSYRRKRKINLTQDDIWGVINNPKTMIKAILSRTDIKSSDHIEVPQQMRLFETYYNEE